MLLCRRFSFLSLFAGLRLEVGDDGRRVHIAAVELALVGEQVLDIVFTDGKRSAGRTTDVQDLGNVLPCLIPSYLGRKGRREEGKKGGREEGRKGGIEEGK